MPKRTSTMTSLNMTVAANPCPPAAAAPAVAQTLTLTEVMYRSPKRNMRAAGKNWNYEAVAAARNSTAGCARIPLPLRRSPSPALSPFELFTGGDTNSARKRLRSFQQNTSSMANSSSLTRSITPASSGRRSETPLSASNRINQPSTAASPHPCAPLPPRLPTARVLFGQAPTIAETQDFFTQVEFQLREDFEGNRRIGTPQPRSVLNPEPSSSLDSLWESEV